MTTTFQDGDRVRVRATGEIATVTCARPERPLTCAFADGTNATLSRNDVQALWPGEA